MATPLTNDLERTIEVPQPNTSIAPRGEEAGNSILELRSPSASLAITEKFQESTRRLLRIRLMISATTTLGFLFLLKTAVFLFGDTTLYDLMNRLSASIVLTGATLYLYRTPKASIRHLRLIEGLVGVALTTECIWVLVSESQKRIATGELEQLPSLFMAVSFAFAIFIAIYGMFIPNAWHRTGLITCLAAFVPLVAALVLRQYLPELQSVEDFPGYAAPTLTFAMALVATLAAHVVHQIRREVQTAKQYGQYHLLEEIGQGGMGVVYKAKHRMLKRPAAIKVIRAEIASDPKTIAEFEREVQLSAELTHWNSVQIYDYGRTDDGDFFYVMEHLEGDTLYCRIKRRGKLTNDETVTIINQVCDGLHEAHLKGMVHRDIKPANIFLSRNTSPNDVVKILDFGLAVMKSDTDRLRKLSGTPAYISPEQIQGKTIDERCDIYALGCVIFECLSGQLLFTGDTVNELLAQHINQMPSLERLPDSASHFRDIIAMCVKKDPEHRFKNVAALKVALSSCV